jgi:hypothetical protein
MKTNKQTNPESLVDVIYNPSYNNIFTQKLYSICPGCSGVLMSEYSGSDYFNSCTHHQHEYTSYKIEKYEKQDNVYNNQASILSERQKLSRLVALKEQPVVA